MKSVLPLNTTILARIAAIGGLGLVSGAMPVSIHAQAVARHDSRAPIQYAADRIEVQERQNRVILSGQVDVTQSNLRVRADRVTVNYTDDTNGIEVQRLLASGAVRVTRDNENASGDAAVYDVSAQIITLTGNVHLNRSGDTITGSRLTVNLATGVSSLQGGAGTGSSRTGNRVTGTFSPPKK